MQKCRAKIERYEDRGHALQRCTRRDKNSRWSSAKLNWRFQVRGIAYWFFRERYTNQKGLSMASFAHYKWVWRSSMHAEFKKKLFVTTVKTILLYGCETWTLTARNESRLNDWYTRMMRMVMNITLMDKVANEDLCGNLPRILNKIRERTLRLAGHCVKHSELKVSNLVLWEPTQGKFNRESQRLTYVDRLRKHTGFQTTAELKTLMKDKCAWRAITRGDSTWWW